MIPPIRNEDIDWAEQILGGGISFDGKARAFIRNLDSIHLVACPGSGKTTALTAKLLIISRNLPLTGNRGICILTHTNVAVEQIRSRVGALGQCLFSYPNFCGTFQTFVGKFLGHPAYVEHFGYRPICVDSEIATRELLNGNPGAIRAVQTYLDRQYLTLESLRFNNNLQIVQYGKDQPFVGMHTHTYRTVSTMKSALLKAGILFYDDVYVFAERHLSRHPELANIFPKRFPFVFVDEMQDTEERQLAIINLLFPPKKTVLQLVGDPNQAIYYQSAVGHECVWEPPDGSPELMTSHRFSTPTANIVSNLTAICPANITGMANTGNIKPHLIVFSNSRIEEVIPAFGGLITDHGLHRLDDNRGFKAVGWVGKRHESKHTLPSYWPQFEAKRIRRQSSYVTLKGILSTANSPKEFGSPKAFRTALMAGIVGLLKAGEAKTSQGRRFTMSSLLHYLIEEEEKAAMVLERQSAEWCLHWGSGEDVFEEVSAFLSDWLPSSFNVDIENGKVISYLNDDDEFTPLETCKGTPDGYCFDGGIIDVSSVHAVKGETHTATLLLETFYNGYDIHRILPYLKGQAPTGREGVRVKESLKVSFVACSRPTHLLGIAIHADTTGFRKKRKQVTDGDLSELEELWEIVDLR